MTSRILLYGVGAIGQSVAQAAATRTDLQVTAAVDRQLGGRDLFDVAGVYKGVRISRSIGEAVSRGGADCAIHATDSRLNVVLPQLLEIVDAGISVVSSCEELCVPAEIDPAVARRLDQRALDQGVSIVAAGVNPGLVMDALPVLLASACIRVDRIQVERVVDLARRRIQLQRKIGVGLAPDEFVKIRDTDRAKLGHVGLAQSATAIARFLDGDTRDVRSSLEPIVRENVVVGSVERYSGIVGTTPVELTLRMEMIPTDEHDSVQIDGDPPIHLVIPGGIHGDRATVGRLLNAVRYAQRVQGLNPGFLW